MSKATPKRIYYAHSMKKYGTPQEKKELKAIKNRYPKAEIINPADLTYDNKGMDMFVKIIKSVDLVVFTTYKGYIGKGVYTEIRTPTTIELLHANKFYRSVKVEIYNSRDWKVKYAKVVSKKEV